MLKTNKIVNYKIRYYEKLFPWLTDLIAIDEDDEIPVKIGDDNIDDDNEDRVKNFLTQEEYRALPSVERNQKALDRYLESRNKSKWAIGRDYEMYVGYFYEQKGYSIEYKGIICQPLKKLNRFLPMDKEKLLIKSWVNCLGV